MHANFQVSTQSWKLSALSWTTRGHNILRNHSTHCNGPSGSGDMVRGAASAHVPPHSPIRRTVFVPMSARYCTQNFIGISQVVSEIWREGCKSTPLQVSCIAARPPHHLCHRRRNHFRFLRLCTWNIWRNRWGCCVICSRCANLDYFFIIFTTKARTEHQVLSHSR